MKSSAVFPACPGGRPVPDGGPRDPSTRGSRRVERVPDSAAGESHAPRTSVVRPPRPRDRRTGPPPGRPPTKGARTEKEDREGNIRNSGFISSSNGQ
jgi:hypothetical protein